MSTSAVMVYGRTVRALRQFTLGSMNREPEWRQPANGQAGGAPPDEQDP
jgi:hypothetical protein